jgi:hypothetical protein
MLYSPANNTRQVKSRRMRWAVHVALVGEEREMCRVLMGKREGKNRLEDQDVEGRMVSEWILVRLAGVVEWIQLAQDRGRWQTLVNTVINLWFLAPRFK